MADIWKHTLKTMGFDSIQIFENAHGVMEELETELPAIILMDINLRGSISGLELTALLTEKYPSIKILMVTIHNETSYIEKAISAGASGYITKNSSIAQFKSSLEAILEGGTSFPTLP